MIGALEVALSPAVAATRDSAPLAVVIDVLRASTSIVAALENGATGVIPVRDVDDAMALQRRLGRDFTRLAGERNSTLIAGFDIDNSPASFTPEKVADRTIVMTTTNGTRALVEAARGKGLVLVGALVNRAAVAAAIAARDDREALLICAGSEGAVSFEDTLAAGAIVDALLALAPQLAIGDAAHIAHLVWQRSGAALEAAVASGTHARALTRQGFGADVTACARLDVSACVPRLVEGVLRAGS